MRLLGSLGKLNAEAKKREHDAAAEAAGASPDVAATAGAVTAPADSPGKPEFDLEKLSRHMSHFRKMIKMGSDAQTAALDEYVMAQPGPDAQTKTRGKIALLDKKQLKNLGSRLLS
eukprot:SAG31_NODE_7059_length_1800_cov_2.988830_3_plen_116_part_00